MSSIDDIIKDYAPVGYIDASVKVLKNDAGEPHQVQMSYDHYVHLIRYQAEYEWIKEQIMGGLKDIKQRDEDGAEIQDIEAFLNELENSND